MKISKRAFSILAMAVVIAFAAQPIVQAGQNLDFWKVEDVRGDSSTGRLTVYYEVVGWDVDSQEELALMFFFLRLYEKQTKTWHLISAVADRTVSLTTDVQNVQRQELQDFFDGPVLARLCPTCGYTSIHLTGVENDYHNLDSFLGNGPSQPPYCVSADITLVAK